MSAAAPPATNPPVRGAAEPRAAGEEASKSHLRGSSLLLAGRLLAVGLNFLVQVLIVRYLSREAYGAFAYALSVMAVGSSLTVFCLDKSLARFLPIYQERGDYDRVFGTVLMAAGAVAALGAAWVAFFLLFHGWIAASFIREPQALRLVMLLLVLAPLDAWDCLAGSLFAVFAKPKDIFFPRHLLAPLLQFGLVLLFIFSRQGVLFFAGAYVAVSLLGSTIHTTLLIRALSQQGILTRFNRRTLQVPAREVLAFTFPLLVSDLVFILRSSLVVVLLEHFRGSADVAAFRAVFPVARLNLLVFESFTVLFMPMAARLFARGDRAAINGLYWGSAAWIALLTFPVFALSFSLASPLTVLLYGQRYAGSALVLALLALGHYFTAALGFNGITLQVFGKIRYLIGANLAGAALSLALYLVLIPRYGALGAAAGTAATIVAQNLFYQAGLRLGGVHPLDPRYLRVYAGIVLGAGALLALQTTLRVPLWVGLPAAAVLSLALLRSNRRLLRIEDSFPELLRVPLARRLLAG